MKNYKFLFVVSLCVFMSACAPQQPLSPVEYSGLLLKTKELFILCTILIEHGLYSQVIPRLYYGYYHIARLIVNNKFSHDISNHTDVWKHTPKDIKLKGLQLKLLRVKYDYEPNIVQSEFISDINDIYANKDLLEIEIQEFNKDIAQKMTQSDIDNNHINDLLQQIETEHSKLMEKVHKAIPPIPQS